MGWSAKPGPDASEEPRGLEHSGAPSSPQPHGSEILWTYILTYTDNQKGSTSLIRSFLLLSEEMKSQMKEDPSHYIQKLLKRIRLGKWPWFKFQCVKDGTSPSPPTS